jgi:diguanylate cyclase (GGDEF)-like protein/PAS domain S-box-containing protein
MMIKLHNPLPNLKMPSLSLGIKGRWNPISVTAAVLILLTAVGGILIGANAIRLFSDMRATWLHYDTVSEQKVSYLIKIHTYLGYSGMSQHLDDYLLHGDQRLLALIDIDLDQAKNSIDSYRLLDINEDEAQALTTLRALVLKTRQEVLDIPALRDQGLTPEQIDRRINLNPDAAIAALNQLQWAWRQQAEQIQQKMDSASISGIEMVQMGWIFLPIMAVISAIVFWLVNRLCSQVIAYKNEKAALEVSERKFRDMAANVPGVIFQWYERTGGERGYLYVSPRCQELYGVSPDELKKNWNALTLHPDDEKRYLRTIADAFEKREEWSFEGRFLTPGGEEKWGRFLSKPVPMRTNDNEIIFNGVMIDISMQKKMEEDLRVLATTDALTGAKNRRYFLQVAEEELIRAKRYGAPLSVLMMDLDHFKHINDTHGHAGGDEVLRRFVAIAKEHLRATDILGRIGGEEFAILLPETDAAGAFVLAERIRQTVSDTAVCWDGKVIHVSVSQGISCLDRSDDNIHDLVSRADKALYAAKAQGRNCTMAAASPTSSPLLGKSPATRAALAGAKPGRHGTN